jgi:hypothetical protein
MPARLIRSLTDQKHQPDAYLRLADHLYEVVAYERDGVNSGRLHVLNSHTLHPLWLTDDEVIEAQLVHAGPEPFKLPTQWDS